MNEWNIQSRAAACESCQHAFADKAVYHTLLSAEPQGYRRLDVCAGCWQAKHADDTARKGFISHWQGVFEAPTVAVEAIQKETAESVLRKLIELNDPQYIPAAFILAVMLERKRILKVKEQLKSDGRRVFIYEQPRTGDLFTVVDPNLQLNQLEQVQKDVAALLEHGLNPPVPAPSAETGLSSVPAEAAQVLPPATPMDSVPEPALAQAAA